MLKKKTFGIYIHIPFCVKKCEYCDFLSMPSSATIKKNYVQALLEEMNQFSFTKEMQLVSIFFGGGTPSSIPAQDIKQVLDLIRQKLNLQCFQQVEVTLEMNPGTVTKEKLELYKQSGVNRISIGLQSTDNQELKTLGRIHTYEQFLETYQLVRAAGFDNINIDLMSALPNQSIDSWKETLERVLALRPTHISAYSLIIEEGTPFYDMYGEGKLYEDWLPTEEVDREMYHLTKTMLASHGYHRYEISNYALEGYECVHNTLYWTGVPYVGFGVGASSYINGIRYQNESDLSEYIEKTNNHQNIKQDLTILTKEEQMEEFMFLGLRLTKGINATEFQERFQKDIYGVYGSVIEKFVEEGLLVEENGFIRLTEQGLDVSNFIMSEFLLG